MSTMRGDLMELTGKFLALSADQVAFDFLVMPDAKQIRVPVLVEATGVWRTAIAGQKMTIRVSRDFVARSGLSSGSPSTLLGGQILTG